MISSIEVEYGICVMSMQLSFFSYVYLERRVKLPRPVS